MKYAPLALILLLSSCDSLYDYLDKREAMAHYLETVEKFDKVPLYPEEIYPDAPEKGQDRVFNSGTPMYAGEPLSASTRTALQNAMQQATHVQVVTDTPGNGGAWDETVTTAAAPPVPMTPEARALVQSWSTAPQWLLMELSPTIAVEGYFKARTHYVFTDADGKELGRMSEGMPYNHYICRPEGQEHYSHMAEELSRALKSVK